MNMKNFFKVFLIIRTNRVKITSTTVFHSKVGFFIVVNHLFILMMTVTTVTIIYLEVNTMNVYWVLVMATTTFWVIVTNFSMIPMVMFTDLTNVPLVVSVVS